mmetsp:Transcript_19332/g.39992  ORF Transcript_19332/g.39992 Transcript_19332/m.39992 type:complete len:117 (-) Transcript_19332:1374-1724(-)
MPAVEADAERRAEIEAGPTSWPSSGRTCWPRGSSWMGINHGLGVSLGYGHLRLVHGVLLWPSSGRVPGCKGGVRVGLDGEDIGDEQHFEERWQVGGGGRRAEVSEMYSISVCEPCC